MDYPNTKMLVVNLDKHLKYNHKAFFPTIHTFWSQPNIFLRHHKVFHPTVADFGVYMFVGEAFSRCPWMLVVIVFWAGDGVVLAARGTRCAAICVGHGGYVWEAGTL